MIRGSCGGLPILVIKPMAKQYLYGLLASLIMMFGTLNPPHNSW